jgi:hypothetical protein
MNSSSEWDNLKRRYEGSGVTLFLGAGVSLASGIPTWDALVCRMMEENSAATGGKETFKVLRDQGFTLPTITEFIEQQMQDQGKFLALLRKCLYRDFPFNQVKSIASKANEFLEHTRTKNPTLEAVYNLAVHEQRTETGTKRLANRNVHAIVSLNLDELLEAYDIACKSKAGRDAHRCLHTIESPSHDRNPTKTTIYHPHGFLRFDRHQDDLKKEAGSKVLSEHEFFDFYSRSTDIFTYTLLFMACPPCAQQI